MKPIRVQWPGKVILLAPRIVTRVFRAAAAVKTGPQGAKERRQGLESLFVIDQGRENGHAAHYEADFDFEKS